MRIHPGRGVSTATICCAQFIASSDAIRARGRNFWQNIQQLFHQDSFKLMVQQAAADAVRERSSPDSPSRSFDSSLWRDAEDRNHILYDTVDKEGSQAFRMFETIWHILLGQPAQQTNYLDRQSEPYLVDGIEYSWRKRQKDYWCSWFEDQTNSPCSFTDFKKQCSYVNGRLCQKWGTEVRHSAPKNMTYERLLSGDFCCGHGEEAHN